MTIAQLIAYPVMKPLELLFDVVFAVAYQAFRNPGISIIFLSFAINLIVLPLYKRADTIQEETRQEQLRMQPSIRHIKDSFSGDERFMMLQTYYRQRHYKPYYALKGSISLLLELPFFLAAYRFLSQLQMLKGAAFGPIQDLGSPDGLLTLGGVALNVLPVVMTGINLISGAIYTRGLPWKNRIQLYGMALLFLVLLYESPAGLVFYWTLNNLFSLCKNLLFRIPFCRGFKRAPSPKQDRRFYDTSAGQATGARRIFHISCIGLTVLTGILIPGSVIQASPSEFVYLQAYASPLRYIFRAFLLATGTFLLWPLVYYFLASATGRKVISVCFAILLMTGTMDYMFFGNEYGNMSSLLIYDEAIITNSKSDVLLNMAIVLGLAGVILILYKKRKTLVQVVCMTVSIVLAVLGVSEVANIYGQDQRLQTQATQSSDEKLHISLDASGKNVIVLMLDRAISGFLPFMMQENPELQRQFDGFTYYPNTISFGGYTNVGVPPLFGGYEYTPTKMNERSNILLRDKHNEALKVMPVNFLKRGFKVSVCDVPYANYSAPTDLSIYDDWPEIACYHAIGSFTEVSDEERDGIEHLRNRNLFCYSVFRIVPLALQTRVYNMGFYNETAMLARNNNNIYRFYQESNSKGYGYDPEFIDNYSVLTHLSEVTEIQDTGECTFLMMSNETTHEPMLLSEPDFEPRLSVDNTAYDTDHSVRYAADGRELILKTFEQVDHYQVNMAVMIKIGAWLDDLRERGVYDNTRIIIVSDHGRNLGLFGMQLPHRKQVSEDLMFYQALLMVKDFDSRELRSDETFMTVADTPFLAFKDLVQDPVNPSLDTKISDEDKNLQEQHILYTPWSIFSNNGTVFQGDEKEQNVWLTLKGHDALNVDNWTVDP